MPSEVIRGFSYDEDTRTLFVTFTSGDLYAYQDVEREVVRGWKAAISKGRYFSRHIRDRYAYGKVEDPSAVRLKPAEGLRP